MFFLECMRQWRWNSPDTKAAGASGPAFVTVERSISDRSVHLDSICRDMERHCTNTGAQDTHIRYTVQHKNRREEALVMTPCGWLKRRAAPHQKPHTAFIVEYIAVNLSVRPSSHAVHRSLPFPSQTHIRSTI